jgi:hypothetical protein
VTPYALRRTEFPAQTRAALADLVTVRDFLRALPEPAFVPAFAGRPGTALGHPECFIHGPEWSCHALARAAREALPLNPDWKVTDGLYLNRYSHAWLEWTMPSRRDRLILDVLPVAIPSGPMVVDANYASKWNWSYEPMPMRFNPAEYLTFQREAALAVAAWRGATGRWPGPAPAGPASNPPPPGR